MVAGVFVWSIWNMLQGIGTELISQDAEGTSGFQRILEKTGHMQEFERLQTDARNILRQQAAETFEEARTDPDIRAMFDNLMKDVAVPAAQQAIRQHQSELAAAFEKQSDAWMDDLRNRVENRVNERMREIVQAETNRLLAETDLSEEEAKKIVDNIRAVSQQAVQDMMEERMEDWDTEIKAMKQARSTIIAEENMPEDIEEYNPVYVLLKLLGYKLQDLDVKSDADLQDTLRSTIDSAVQ
jgi:signal recognition particle GTPase